MSRHSKLMSQHKTKLKAEKLYRDIEILCRDTINSSKKETLSRQSFIMEHDMSPNFSGVVHVHSLYLVVAHKSKMEVSLGVAQIGIRLALNNATQQSRNI